MERTPAISRPGEPGSVLASPRVSERGRSSSWQAGARRGARRARLVAAKSRRVSRRSGARAKPDRAGEDEWRQRRSAGSAGRRGPPFSSDSARSSGRRRTCSPCGAHRCQARNVVLRADDLDGASSARRVPMPSCRRPAVPSSRDGGTPVISARADDPWRPRSHGRHTRRACLRLPELLAESLENGDPGAQRFQPLPSLAPLVSASTIGLRSSAGST